LGFEKTAVESFSHLWREHEKDYVLLKVDGSDRTSTEGCLIYNTKRHSVLVIEDDDLAEEIMKKMRAAGVAIVFRQELPPGKSELEQLIDEMLETRKTPAEINEAIRTYDRENH
jgi:hypothetical protein